MSADLDRAADFIARQARLLDRHRFALIHGPEEGRALAAQRTRAALAGYANPDGGFGHALEPDLRGPDSQPLPTQHALETLLDDLGAPDDPLVAAALDWLGTITTPEGGVPFVLASAYAHPRAPWWEAGEEPSADLNPTASLAGLLLRHGIEHPWLERAVAFCWARLETLESSSAYELRAILPFLEHARDQARAQAALERIAPMIADAVTLDPRVDGTDLHRPLDFAPSPASPARALFDDATIEANLDALADGQGDDGGWHVDWLIWTPAAGTEWRGIQTIRRLGVLAAYGRLERAHVAG